MRPASRETVASRIHLCPDGFVIIYRAPMSNSRRLFSLCCLMPCNSR